MIIDFKSFPRAIITDLTSGRNSGVFSFDRIGSTGFTEKVGPGDSQGRRLFEKLRAIARQTNLTKSVEALAAPGFQRWAYIRG